ncbi:MAG: hypothetical protein R2867_10610 [Caldilineaceae bacterium]
MVALHNEDGEVVAVNIVIEEITERKRAEEALRERSTFSQYGRHGAGYAVDH